MGAGGIGIAIGNVRCVWVSDSHALKPQNNTIHTEKLFKAFAVGRSVHAFGAAHYISDLVELGYHFEIPNYDSIQSGTARLTEYLHSEPPAQDAIHNRSVLHSRTQNNPLPLEFETTRTVPANSRPNITAELRNFVKSQRAT